MATGRDVFGTYVTDDDYEKAKQLGICKNTLKSRISSGWRVKKAITEPVKFENRYCKEYQKHKQVAISNGINVETFKRRILRGWTYERASATPLISPVISGGNSHKTRKRVIPSETVEEAKKNGICYSTLYSRFIKGVHIPHDKIATRPPMNRREMRVFTEVLYLGVENNERTTSGLNGLCSAEVESR